ncbi:Fimbria A protein [Providencia alcalifaciens]|uniref:fimbrial protein n=1 Tax=Providencia TaxID=586 RepID=UPI00044DBF9D|nr:MULTISPECIES: fimbrial protein [Providencia]EUD04927.1 putative fimbria A protein [Providencia alcalifaciens RIMD 1656011]QLQ97666.1 fimbrial protein [Providencia alcalifaciens]CAG9406789.1 Fimbria A protein [Providencia alcalifaciens]
MKRIILTTLISGAIGTPAFATDAGKGIVTFTGSIIEAPCSIAPGDESQTIDLGQVSNVTLQEGKMSSAQPFEIHLQGCTLNATYTDKDGKEHTYNNMVEVKFEGTEWLENGTNTGLIQITGEASGAGVALMNKSGTKININSSTTERAYASGDNTLSFQAALQGQSGATVVPGSFRATTNFTLAYN